VAETGTIIEYLLEQVPGTPLKPAAGTAEHRRYSYWLHFAEGSAMSPLLMMLIFNRIKSAPMPFFAKPIARTIADRTLDGFVKPNISRQLAYMEAELAAREWFAGSAFSAADVMISFPLEVAATRAGLDAAHYPKLAAFLERIHARPAYQRALERGGPYALMR
jgi:glutathione S-transferase